MPWKRYWLISIISVIILILYGIKKLHLQNYWRGRRELTQYRKDLRSNKCNSERLQKFIYIAHAGGGLRGKSYLNNLEAIDNSVSLGVKYIELDFNYAEDSIVVLSHDLVKSSAAFFLKDRTKGTHLTLDSLAVWLRNKDVSIITDIKTDNLKILKKIVAIYPEIVNKIIPQVYSISQIIPVKKMGYKRVIFTNYMANYPNYIIQELGKEKCLFALTMPDDINIKLLDVFSLEIPICIHTVNDIKVVEKLKKAGCSGVYTDSLLY